jgi:hypothetical protein
MRKKDGEGYNEYRKVEETANSQQRPKHALQTVQFSYDKVLCSKRRIFRTVSEV